MRTKKYIGQEQPSTTMKDKQPPMAQTKPSLSNVPLGWTAGVMSQAGQETPAPPMDQNKPSHINISLGPIAGVVPQTAQETNSPFATADSQEQRPAAPIPEAGIANQMSNAEIGKAAAEYVLEQATHFIKHSFMTLKGPWYVILINYGPLCSLHHTFSLLSGYTSLWRISLPTF